MSRIGQFILGVDAKEAAEALEYLTAREQQVRQIKARCWSPPALTPEQKEKQDAYIEEHQLPF